MGANEAFTNQEPVAVGSNIDFFPRHPEDSTNPLTFLGGGSSDGTSDTTTGATATELVSAKEVQTVEQGKSSKSSEWASVCSSSAGPGSDLLREVGSSNNDRSPPIPILKAPRKFTGDGRRIPRYPQMEKETIWRTRPATLHELPGRFRGKEPCWYCCDGVEGERCEVCAAVVRVASPETWGGRS